MNQMTTMASAHFIDTVKKGMRNVHRRLSVITLGPCQQLWMRGSHGNKLRSSEFYWLVLYFKGTVPALFLFSPVIHFPEILQASENSSRISPQWSEASRNHPVPWLCCLKDVGVKRDTKKDPFLPLWRRTPSNFSFSSSCRLISTYSCGEEKGSRVCVRELSLSPQ